jgi:cytochrome P450
VLSTHSDTTGTEPFHKQLASVPLSAWEGELPALDLIIRETIRLSSTWTFLRRNLRTDIDTDGVRIAKGDFMAYFVPDVHMNENIYPNPGTFDPGRYEDGRNEDKSVDFGYLGWGAGKSVSILLNCISGTESWPTGRHPCVGMRIAKLEIKIVLAMALCGYDYTVVDENGNQTNRLPKPDPNDTLQVRFFL